MNIKDISFRELYQKVVFVKGGKLIEGFCKGFIEQGYTPPSYADSSLGYCYIDQEVGISFSFLCFAHFASERIDMNSYKHQLSIKSMNLFRYHPDYEIKMLIGDAVAFSERINMIEEGYHSNVSVLSTRMIAEIDHLRHESCPDDIRVLLRKNGLESEWPWVRLTEMKEKKLFGVLLNEPFKDFGFHSGDTVRVELGAFEGKVYAVLNSC